MVPLQTAITSNLHYIYADPENKIFGRNVAVGLEFGNCFIFHIALSVPITCIILLQCNAHNSNDNVKQISFATHREELRKCIGYFHDRYVMQSRDKADMATTKVNLFNLLS